MFENAFERLRLLAEATLPRAFDYWTAGVLPI